jgi:hypothetical protein
MIKDLGNLVNNPQITGIKADFKTLNDVISVGFNVVLLLAGFLAFFWLVWGAFQYLLARGNKEELSRARARITWALIGLFIIFLAYLIANLAVGILRPRGGVPL